MMPAHADGPAANVPHATLRPARPAFRRDALQRYAIALAATAVVVFAGGWWTDLRQVMHGAVLTVAVFAFLPFVIIAAGLVLAMALMAMSLLVALIGDGGGDAVASDAGLADVGASMAPGYYRFLFARFVARRRHPVFWGVPSGLLLGGMALWLVIGSVVVPGEIQTVETLADAKRGIELHYADHGGYPDPTPTGHLRRADVNLSGKGDVVHDGFGRPIEYRKHGFWKVASYTLRSDGFDGQLGKDDLHESGATTLGSVTRAVEVDRDEGKLSIRIRLQRMRESRQKGG